MGIFLTKSTYVMAKKKEDYSIVYLESSNFFGRYRSLPRERYIESKYMFSTPLWDFSTKNLYPLGVITDEDCLFTSIIVGS